MSDSTNIFDYATSELSQDAFLLWLLAHAEGGNSQSRPDVTRCAKAMLRTIFEKYSQKLKAPLTSEQIEAQLEVHSVHKQYLYIDVLVLTPAFALIIEDKTSTGLRKHQLEDYAEKLQADELPDGREIIRVYYKTDDECRPPETAQVCLYRKDMETILAACEREGAFTSEILIAYRDRLQSISSQYDAWREEGGSVKKCVNDWGYLGLPGFYQWLRNNNELRTADPDEDGWDWVNNPNGGFWGLWWHPVEKVSWPVFGYPPELINDIYLQIETRWTQDAGNVAFVALKLFHDGAYTEASRAALLRFRHRLYDFAVTYLREKAPELPSFEKVTMRSGTFMTNGLMSFDGENFREVIAAMENLVRALADGEVCRDLCEGL